MWSCRYLAIVMLGAAAACSSGGQAPRAGLAPAPAEPESTLVAFLAAARAGDLGRMGELWGDERGPSTVTGVIPAEERQRRLTIMQRLLISDSHRWSGWAPSPTRLTRRVFQVELTREGRRATVPFTLAPSRRGGWLVAEIGLDAAVPLARPSQP
jgi:hypothetical protein